MIIQRFFAHLALFLSFLFLLGITAFAQETPKAQSLLNVSYDLSRELYKEMNPAFVSFWREKTGETVIINQSHGGSSKQVLAVMGGLEADIVTMNQVLDLETLATRGGFVAKDWRQNLPFEAAPYSTATVFIVRKGNSKGIKDWDDLTQKGVSLIIPNPKTSGNGRYTYLSAWVYAFKKSGTEAGAREFVKKMFDNVPVFDGGGRGATTTFAQRDMGDVLITFENEAASLAQEFGADKFEVVYPSLSVEAVAPVALVTPVVAKRGTGELAKAYLNFLFSAQGQEIIARHHFRPRDQAVFARYKDRFPAIATFKVEALLGSWEEAQKAHFADGAIYDQIMAGKQ